MQETKAITLDAYSHSQSFLEYVPQFRALSDSLNATYPSSHSSLRPSLFPFAEAIAHNLGLQSTTSHLLQSIDAAITALTCMGFKFYDTSPTTMVDVSSPLLVDFPRSELVSAHPLPDLVYKVLVTLLRLRLPARRASWVRTMRKYEEIVSGGGEAFFQMQHGEKLDETQSVYKTCLPVADLKR